MHQLLTAAEAVQRYVRPGDVVGLGGQNISRCPMALAHEVIRQRIGGLTVVGCNLSLPLDQLVAAGLVSRTEQGSGNLERFGVLYSWRRAAERGEITVRDYSHLAMASRFLAGSLGLPFMPTLSLLGTDLTYGNEDLRESTDPWTGRPVVLLRSLSPDVSLVHATRADEDGNVVIDGVTTHEVDMIKASQTAIVSVEEVVPRGTFEAEHVTISSAYVTAVVRQPFGAFPTSVYRRYDYHEPEIVEYQRRAKADEDTGGYLAEVTGGSFDDYLAVRDPDGKIRHSLEESMRGLL